VKLIGKDQSKSSFQGTGVGARLFFLMSKRSAHKIFPSYNSLAVAKSSADLDAALNVYIRDLKDSYSRECKRGAAVHITEQLANFLQLPVDRPLTWGYVCRCIEIYIAEKKLIQKSLINMDDKDLASLLKLPMGTRVSFLTVHMLLHKHLADPARSQGFVELLEDDVAARARRVLSGNSRFMCETAADLGSKDGG
jgi:hypothetical protein